MARRLRIFLSSHFFHPSIGGIETVSMQLAEGFARLGHEVEVFTQTACDVPARYGFSVFRKAGWRALFAAIRRADVVFHSNITMRAVWPLLLLRRPWVVTHHTWIARMDGSRGRDEIAKLALLPAAFGISISEPIAKSIQPPSIVIPNAYRDDVFKVRRRVVRDRDVVFMGRLVSDKGVDLLLRALALLNRKGLRLSATVVGGGAEEGALKALASELELGEQVVFTGPLTGERLADELERHRAMVVPSRWNEPFGVVALEGLACGCVVVGSNGGGLVDAIGPCGPTFRNGDFVELADKLAELFNDSAAFERYRSRILGHLAKHAPERVTERYLEAFRRALGADRESVV